MEFCPGSELLSVGLRRGEAGVYPSSQPSINRIQNDNSLTDLDRELINRLLVLNERVWGSRTGDGGRGLAWAQHYGFPTHFLDVTHMPIIACHFAAACNRRPAPKHRSFFRIDFEKAIGRLHALYIGTQYCTRGKRQEAWALFASENNKIVSNFDLQSEEYVERFIIGAKDAKSFLIPNLIDDKYDGYATWPVAILRGFKYLIHKPIPYTLASWLCDRIPLYDWIPCDVHFGLSGLSENYSLRSPYKASQEDGKDYKLDKRKFIDELTSNRYQTPNPILFAMLRGQPFSKERLGPGSRFNVVMWMDGFPYIPHDKSDL